MQSHKLTPLSNIMESTLQQQAIEVMETIEDSVEYLCNDYQLSGEKVWTMIAALADAKLNEFPDNSETM